MRRLLTLTLFTFCLQTLFAQKEINYWYYGYNSGHTYVNGNYQTLPAVPNGPYPYCTSYADANGNLQFIFTGQKVLDRNYNTMPGSTLIVNQANSHIVLSAQLPGNPSQFYLFYVASNVLRYALIDLSLNGGYGQVISADNIIDQGISQAFTLVNKKGSADFWIVTHVRYTDTYHSWLVTAAGISATPVTSTAGTNAIKAEYNYFDMKTSPNGEMIAGVTTYYYPGIFSSYGRFTEVFNIDSQTGLLTNKVKSTRQGYVYDNPSYLEFSPDNKLLYVAYSMIAPGLQPCGFGSTNLVQYNLCYTDSTTFSRYAPTVYNTFSWCYYFYMGKTRLGPDKKIYIPYAPTLTMSAINSPNTIGTHCDVNFNAHTVPAGNAYYNMPDFYHAYTQKAVINNIDYAGCYPNPMYFKITNDTIVNVQWNFGDPAGSGNVFNGTLAHHIFSAPGIYTVTANLYASSGDFIETVSTIVEVKDPGLRLLHNYPTDTVLCQGQTLKLQLDAYNGIFAWSHTPPNGTNYFDGISDSTSITSSGAYYVELIQNGCNGCSFKDSIHVTFLPSPTFSLGPDNFVCTGDSLRLSAYAPGADFLWNTGDVNDHIYAKTAGQYWVRAEYNHNGCPVSDTIVITERPNFSFSLPNDTTVCNSQPLLLNPGVPNAYYMWQNYSSNPTFNVTTAGKYWVRITSANGCVHSDTVVVNYVNAQSVYLGRDTTLCSGDSLHLYTTIANSSYLWNTGAIDSVLTVKTGGQYWLQVNNGACTVADTINITFNPLPYFNLGNDTTICANSKLLLSTGIANAVYQWQDGSTNTSFTATRPGSYWARVTQQGCSYSDTLQLGTKPIPPVDLGNDTTICTGATLLLQAAGSQTGSYTWQDNTSAPSYLVTTKGMYWVHVSGVNGCANADTINVNQLPLPDFTLGKDTALCEQQQLTYSFNLPGAAYTWNTGSSSAQQIISQPGTYWLEVNQQGCKKRDSIDVLYKPLPQVNLGNDTTLCEGGLYTLDPHSTGNPAYIWQDKSTNAVFNVHQQGTYWVAATLNGCTTADTIKIVYTLKPVFDLGGDTTICTGQLLTLHPNVNGAASYTWQDGSTGATFTVSEPGVYQVTATNNCGSTTGKITVTHGLCLLVMPNAFTPNRDGVNDVFRIKYPWFVKEFHMIIFNRWGEKVFETYDASQGWNGTYKGTVQPVDTYVWTISLTDKEGNKESSRGTVTLIR